MDIAITLCVAAGIACAVIATAKHRSMLGWLAIGTLLPVVGLILTPVLG